MRYSQGKRHLYYIYLCTLEFMSRKTPEPLNEMTSNFVGYLIYSSKMFLYKTKCEVSVVFLFEILFFPHLHTLYRPTNDIVKLFTAKRKSLCTVVRGESFEFPEIAKITIALRHLHTLLCNTLNGDSRTFSMSQSVRFVVGVSHSLLYLSFFFTQDYTE